jgi:hypothetical protein
MHLGGKAWVVSMLAVAACAAADDAPVSRGSSLSENPVLASARRAMGGDGLVAAATTIDALAACDGPSGPFETRVYSSRDGKMRFEQTPSSGQTFVAGIDGQGGWSYDADLDQFVRADSATLTFLRGHELHMIALAPETRFGEPEAQGLERLGRRHAVALRFRDLIGTPVHIYYALEDSLPLGFRVANHTGSGAPAVLVMFEDWRSVDGLRLFTRARFEHGMDTYRYEFTSIRLNSVPDSLLSRGGRLSRR